MVKLIKNSQLTDEITVSDALIGVGFALALGNFVKYLFDFNDYLLIVLLIVGFILMIIGIIIHEYG